jgi:hypothetical protein
MQLTILELRKIIQKSLKEDFFIRGMYTPPTSIGNDRQQMRNLAYPTNPENDPIHGSHLDDVDCECATEDGCDCDDLGPVPPGNPSVIDGISIGQDPYVSDWSSINSRGVSR